jgi:branched-chain amino acid transport system substrate-binding protein
MQRITTLGLALGFALALTGSAAAQVKFGVGGQITGPNAATGAAASRPVPAA